MSDLTGQFIANSYQNLVQKPDLTKEEYYNGVGTQINVINRDAIGTVKMFFPVNNNYNNCFDSNGLGINDWEGWAICDGRNGTPDLRGRFPIAKTDLLNTTAQGGTVPTSPNPGIHNSDVVNAPAFLSLGNRGAAGISSNQDLPLRKPIIQINNIPPHRHTFSFLHRDRGGKYQQWQSRYQTANGGFTDPDDGSVGLRQNLGVNSGSADNNDTQFWMGGGNSGDGTNNIQGQGGLASTPVSFYPPYFVLSFAIRIS